GNELEKTDLIRINTPRPNQTISSPLTITGEARGNWFFEASFPVVLTNWDGLIITQGIAQAKSDWMTTDFVPFEATLTFTVDKNAYSNRGFLILKKDNPSGLPEHDDAIEIPVVLAGVTASPIVRQCADTSDTSCPTDFECIEACGPPVVRYPDDTPPKYYCQLKGYVRNCPICLSKNTLINTPQGAVAVQDLEIGAPVWTVNTSGERVVGFVTLISKTAVPPDHKMVQLVLKDGRTLLVSPGHPTIDGRTVGDLAVGNEYNGSQVKTSERVSYGEGYTYDILPSDDTGFYFANGIMLNSTLH
ncbi:MAG: Gmad2 immunoglobulin-like domain-containing protein, partial [Patescibacteria group bacterium]